MAFDDELDLSQWFSDDETTGEPAAPSQSHQSHVHPHSIESQYILHAVMIHSGNANFGHYFSYIRPGLGILGGFGSSCKGTEPPPIFIYFYTFLHIFHIFWGLKLIGKYRVWRVQR